MSTGKTKIIVKLAKKLGASRRHTRKMVNGFLDCVVETIRKEGHVSLRCFGQFNVRTIAASKIISKNRNIYVPESRRLFFKQSNVLKSQIKRSAPRSGRFL